jgi:hypothetical protein
MGVESRLRSLKTTAQMCEGDSYSTVHEKQDLYFIFFPSVSHYTHPTIPPLGWWVKNNHISKQQNPFLMFMDMILYLYVCV